MDNYIIERTGKTEVNHKGTFVPWPRMDNIVRDSKGGRHRVHNVGGGKKNIQVTAGDGDPASN